MANLIPVTDPADERISAFRDIRERDVVGRQNRFVIEGKVVLRVAVTQSRYALDSLLILENKRAGMSELLERVPNEVPIYTASSVVFDAIAGFHVHRGIMGLCKKQAPETAEDILGRLPRTAVVLVLSGISNHDNMGGIFRNAAAFEAGAILLDRQCCDPLYRKAIRVSVGAALTVPFARIDAPLAAVRQLTALGFEAFAMTPNGEETIETASLLPRTAFIFGSEGDGLSGEVLEKSRTLRIAMSKQFDSLNVAATSAIALHRYWSAFGGS